MFVRTKDGKIFDCYVSEQMGKPIYYPKRSKTNGYIDWNEVYKKSENIIDILEVGDYVNGSLVININYDINLDEDVVESISIFDYSIEGFDVLHEKDIKTVVTKEQFEAMEYRLGG